MTQNHWIYKAFPKTQILNFLAAADQIVSLPVIPCQIYCLALLPTCARLVADKRGPANTRPASSGGIPTLSENTVSHHTERYTRPAEIVVDTVDNLLPTCHPHTTQYHCSWPEGPVPLVGGVAPEHGQEWDEGDGEIIDKPEPINEELTT